MYKQPQTGHAKPSLVTSLLVPSYSSLSTLARYGNIYFRFRWRHHGHLPNPPVDSQHLERCPWFRSRVSSLGWSLANLPQALLRIDHLVQSKRNVITAAGLDQILRDCYDCLKGFNTKIETYSRALGEREQKQMVKDVYRKIKCMHEKEEIANLHRDISTYLAMLQLLLQLAGLYNPLACFTSYTNGPVTSMQQIDLPYIRG
jgi:hypothetical protein